MITPPTFDYTVPVFGVVVNFTILVAAALILKYRITQHDKEIENLNKINNSLKSKIHRLEIRIVRLEKNGGGTK